MSLQEFCFTIEYRKGKLNSAPNVLSRATPPGGSLAVCSTELDDVPFPLSDHDIWKAQQVDPEAQELYKMVTDAEETLDQQPIQNTVLEDKVNRKADHPHHGIHYQIFIPKSLRDSVLRAYHDSPLSGHLGR